ncbi:hypothetical protein BU25DRAFT_382419 [Macroventuria anomochaeta]|uniref:Uncharacterized protein n=1 Tax=Macroventuria anomochaeta TaxID=301207 RepID=A0ACB6SFG8_9PLEO|nr:uncharacterized protein BU25DRAFT_382419 [Macroventuria anomochaeta]KAF2632713.1 hypothetical protein BU25DRAFT_382419 [Macroventuria anomochaeta]
MRHLELEDQGIDPSIMIATDKDTFVKQISESLQRDNSVQQVLKHVHPDTEEIRTTLSGSDGGVPFENVDKDQQDGRLKYPSRFASSILHLNKRLWFGDSWDADDVRPLPKPGSPSSPFHGNAPSSSEGAEQGFSNDGEPKQPLYIPQGPPSNTGYNVAGTRTIAHDPHKHISATLTQAEVIEVDVDDSVDDESSIPSYAASVFTVESLASSASALSDRGGYSAEQIATATRRLVMIVSEDDLLVPLYHSAIDNPDIGPDRLRLEFLASRLVANKARYLAEYIVEKLQPRLSKQQVNRREQQDESSDDEEKVSIVNDDMFHDLKVFGEFLAGSAAFSTLRVQVQSFVLPKVASFYLETKTKPRNQRKADHDTMKVRKWETWLEDVRRTVDAIFLDPKDTLLIKRTLFLFIDAFYLTTDALSIRFGLLEPPLAQNAARLRWKSKFGDRIFSDIVEYRNDGVVQLLPRLERSSGTKVTTATYNRQTGNQQYITPRPVQWLRNGFAKLSTNVSTSSRAEPCIPLHNVPGSAAATAASTNPPAPRSILHLMACMHRNRSRKVLQQDVLEDIQTDRELFRFMRKQYIRHRGRFRNMLSLKSIQGIFFIKFKLPIDDWILQQLPKRICGKLQGQVGQPAEGWGVYYQEGWDRDLISVMIFTVFLVASALFGALWSVFKFDIQGAFGISAYMVAVCAALIPLIAMGVDKPR